MKGLDEVSSLDEVQHNPGGRFPVYCHWPPSGLLG